MTVFKIRDFELAGRIGTLITKGGQVETPAFFPVIDPIRQEVSISDIEEVGFRQVITNAYPALQEVWGQGARRRGSQNPRLQRHSHDRLRRLSAA